MVDRNILYKLPEHGSEMKNGGEIKIIDAVLQIAISFKFTFVKT